MQPQAPALAAAMSGVVPVSGQALSAGTSTTALGLRPSPMRLLILLLGLTLLGVLLLASRAASLSLCPARRNSTRVGSVARPGGPCYWESGPLTTHRVQPNPKSTPRPRQRP